MNVAPINFSSNLNRSKPFKDSDIAFGAKSPFSSERAYRGFCRQEPGKLLAELIGVPIKHVKGSLYESIQTFDPLKKMNLRKKVINKIFNMEDQIKNYTKPDEMGKCVGDLYKFRYVSSALSLDDRYANSKIMVSINDFLHRPHPVTAMKEWLSPEMVANFDKAFASLPKDNGEKVLEIIHEGAPYYVMESKSSCWKNINNAFSISKYRPNELEKNI